MQISDILSLLSLIISIIALYKSVKASALANQLQHDSNNIQMATVELEIRQMIENAKTAMKDIAAEMDSNKNENKEILNAKFKTARETYANAYDEACMKYLDGKIDKERFKKAYYTEIQNLVNNDTFRDLYDGVQSKYKATKKVYNEWFDLEK